MLVTLKCFVYVIRHVLSFLVNKFRNGWLIWMITIEEGRPQWRARKHFKKRFIHYCVWRHYLYAKQEVEYFCHTFRTLLCLYNVLYDKIPVIGGMRNFLNSALRNKKQIEQCTLMLGVSQNILKWCWNY